MTGNKKYCAAVLLTLLLGIGTGPTPSFAVDPDDPATPDLDTEVSAFDNPAQAQHAANLAEQAATSDTSVQNALQDVQDAQGTLDAAMQSDDPEAMSTAQAAMTDAEIAYTDALAAATGVVGSDITSMRDSGMGWGMIAHELGVQPGMLGLGHTRGKQQHNAGTTTQPGMDGIDPQELNEATARNMESGWSSGHGVGVQSGVHDPGTGLFDEQAMESRGRGHDTDRGSGGVSGAGGLGSGGSSDGSMGGGSGASDDHGASSGQGGTAGNSSGPGNSGGHDSAGTDGAPGNSGSSSGSSSSGGMGGSSSSGGHGGSDGRGSY